jgi:hypothetical protein
LHRADAQAERGKEGSGGSTIAQEAKYDVFGTHGFMAQSSRLDPSIFQRTLGVRAKRVRIDPGGGMRPGV